MDLGLKGARCFVAASTAGIGKAAAAELVAEGAHVAICGRDGARLEAATRELEAIAAGAGGSVLGLRGDVSGEGARTLVEEAVGRLGGLDVLVVNQGGPPAGTFAALDDEAWRGAVDLLLLSTVRMVRAAVPHLRVSAQGRIVLVESTTVRQPIPHLVLSNSIRLAVVGLAKSLAGELAPSVTVNVVLPGSTDTDRIRQLHATQAEASGRSVAELAAEAARAIPLGRLARPDEIAAAIAFLASRRASYLTGTAIAVDGGVIRAPV